MCMKMLGEQGVGRCQDSKKEQKDRSASGCESCTLITRGDYLAFLRPPAATAMYLNSFSVFSMRTLSKKMFSKMGIRIFTSLPNRTKFCLVLRSKISQFLNNIWSIKFHIHLQLWDMSLCLFKNTYLF